MAALFFTASANECTAAATVPELSTHKGGKVMETKTLRIIQKLAAVGKVLSKIIAVCCIIGIIGCLIGIVSISTLGLDTFKIGGVTIHSMIEESAEMSFGTLYAYMTVGLILCIGECIIAKKAEKYFRNELTAGTPFTFDGAKEMLRLGIYIIAISVGALIAANISYSIMDHWLSDVAEIHLDAFGQAGTGLAFIIASLLCKFGAEKETESQADAHLL